MMRTLPFLVGSFLALATLSTTTKADDDAAVLKPQLGEANMLLAGAKVAVGEFYGYYKKCPSTNAETGLAEAEQMVGRYVVATGVGTRNGACIVTARFGEKAEPTLRGKFLGARLKADSSWECLSDIDPKILPTDCAGAAAPVSAKATGLLPPPPPPPDLMMPLSRSWDDSRAHNYKQAIVDGQQALALAEQQLGATNPTVGEIAYTIAQYHILDGDNEGARPLIERKLRIDAAPATSNDVDLALAQALSETGRALQSSDSPTPVRATPMLEQALAINERVLGHDNVIVAASLYDLATNYVRQNMYGKAEPLYRRSLNMFDRHSSTDNTIVVLSELGSMYIKQHRYKDAEPLLGRAMDLVDKQPETQASLAAEVRRHLAQLYRETGREAKANALAPAQAENGKPG
jgi:tetratricopeptide (TPR) repeat protein